MLENCGENNEERLKVTREGGTLGYLLLDQGRALALQHARDSRDFCGRRYATHDLVGKVLSDRERRDYYYIKLAYRLAEGFRGKRRVERFTIDNRGAMRLRSVLERSVERKTCRCSG